MVTKKLTAIWRVITHKSFTIITIDKNGVHQDTTLQGSLEDVMLVAVTLKATYDGLMQQINHDATEAGELQTLQALKSVAEKVQDGGQ